MSCQEKFSNELRRRGFRLTPQRRAILEALHDFRAPATAEEVHTRSTALNPGLEFSTVYRTLELLKSFGLVSVVDTGERQQRFIHEETSRPHIHLRCRACGALQELPLDLLNELEGRILAGSRFRIDAASLTIPGTCSKCQ